MDADLEKVSLVRQNYIETIFELSKKKGYAKTKEIAEKLRVKMPSVTQMLHLLASQGLIEYQKRYQAFLTPKGLYIARELERRQSILVKLFNFIGCSKSHAEKIACKIEHNLDREAADRLETLLTLLRNK